MSLLDRLKAGRGDDPPAPATPLSVEQILARLPLKVQASIVKPAIDLRIERYITAHEPTVRMLRTAKLMAFRPEPVLIEGESGTGKELLARIMLGARPNHAFFPVNCAGVVGTLFESLIFGHLKGAFTGANADRPGLILAAGDGVVFFDEIGELPIEQQAKLLRALQEREVMAVGSDRAVPIKCRFVFATNRNLAAMVEARTFREDLYYRISALRLTTYPLRARPDDAMLIVDAKQKAGLIDFMVEHIPETVWQSTGNVRALENWLLQLAVFGLGKDGVNPACGDNTWPDNCSYSSYEI